MVSQRQPSALLSVLVFSIPCHAERTSGESFPLLRHPMSGMSGADYGQLSPNPLK